MKWTLILLASSGSGQALTTIDEFPEKVACEAAGVKAQEALTAPFSTSVRYVCVTRYEK